MTARRRPAAAFAVLAPGAVTCLGPCRQAPPPPSPALAPVLDGAPVDLIARFRELLLSMSYDDPQVRPLLDLEGLKQWKPGRTEKYALLARAIDRDVTHERLDVHDAGGDHGRRTSVVTVRVTAAAAVMAVVGHGGRRAETCPGRRGLCGSRRGADGDDYGDR